MWHSDKGSLTGLVLVFSNTRSALWDPTVSQMVDQIENRLEGVYVTSAVTSAGHPSVADGVAAARFAGCTAVLVVYLGGRSEQLVESEWVLPGEAVTARPDPDAIAATFHAHAARSDRVA